MNIVIIEDEQDAYKRLSKLVKETFEGGTVVAHLDSVHTAKEWFENHPMPDIVFIDINLGDGTGFDVLNMVKIDCPFVFTTAYDEYAIEAFQTNSIAYLLKPVTKDDLQSVQKKIDNYLQMFSKQEVTGQAAKPTSQNYKKRFILKFGEHIKMLSVEEIAYCHSHNRGTMVATFDGRSYPMDYNLDTLEEMLDPQVFFRINRQYIICLKAIADMRTYTKGRIIITLNPPTKETQIVSTERSAEFKQWLDR